jgi:hypothetical protein
MEINGISVNLVNFFGTFIYLGKRESTGDHVFAIGTWNGETIVTLAAQDTLNELPKQAFLLPRRFLTNAYPNLRQQTPQEIAKAEITT